MAIVSREIGAILHVIFHHRMKSSALTILNYLSSDFSATLQKSADDNFISSAFWQSRLSHFGAFVSMHKAGFAADESLINLNMASASAKLAAVLILHCKSDSVKHEPCGFLSDTDCTVNLVRRNAILAVGNHPRGSEPFIKPDGAVLKNGSYLDAELLFGMFGFALPNAASRNEFHVLTTASWTDDTIGPALRHKMTQAVVEIGVEDDCGLQGLRLFHSKTRVPEKGYCVKYIITQTIPDWRRLDASGDRLAQGSEVFLCVP